MGAPREKKGYVRLSVLADLIKYSQLIKRSEHHSSMSATMNKGEGTTVLPPNMIQQTPSGKTTFPVFIRIELNTNKLPHEMNMNSARTPRSRR